MTLDPSPALQVRGLAPHHPAPWSLETRVGDAPLDLQDWVRRYVTLVLELEGSTCTDPPPAPPEAIVS